MSGSSRQPPVFEWPGLADEVLTLERAGLVTRTFRRLDPDRQAGVIQAIFEEAAERGPTGVNIKDVADRAKVSVGSLYQYFGNRDAMIDFAIELCRRHLVSVLEASRPFLCRMPLRDGLACYVTGGVDWAAQQAAMMRLYGRAAYHADPATIERLVRPVASLMRSVVESMLSSAVERGEIRGDFDVGATAGVVHALTIVLGDTRVLPPLNAYFQTQTAEVDADRALLAAIELVIRGLSK